MKADRAVPVGEELRGDRRVGPLRVALQEVADDELVLGPQRAEVDELGVDVALVEVEDVADPPDMPAATLRPVGPRTSAVPPVMYSSPWSPTPSTTAVAPELRTQNRSPTRPRRKSSPEVAP